GGRGRTGTGSRANHGGGGRGPGRVRGPAGPPQAAVVRDTDSPRRQARRWVMSRKAPDLPRYAVRGSGRGSQTAGWAGRNWLHWLAGVSWFFGALFAVHHVGERVVQLRRPATGQAVRQHALEPGRGGGPARSARIRGGPGQLVPAVLVSALRLCPAALAH